MVKAFNISATPGLAGFGHDAELNEEGQFIRWKSREFDQSGRGDDRRRDRDRDWDEDYSEYWHGGQWGKGGKGSKGKGGKGGKGKGAKGGKGGKGDGYGPSRDSRYSQDSYYGPQQRPPDQLDDFEEVDIEIKHFETFESRQIPAKHNYRRKSYEREIRHALGDDSRCCFDGAAYTAVCFHREKERGCIISGTRIPRTHTGQATAKQRFEAAQKAGMKTVLVPKSK